MTSDGQLQSVDEYVGAVEVRKNVRVVVYRRRHKGKEYVRLRPFLRHPDYGDWYPDRHRQFVVPLASAADLGRVLIEAGEGKAGEVPDWLTYDPPTDDGE